MSHLTPGPYSFLIVHDTTSVVGESEISSCHIQAEPKATGKIKFDSAVSTTLHSSPIGILTLSDEITLHSLSLLYSSSLSSS
jgi:hypothetical protein